MRRFNIFAAGFCAMLLVASPRAAAYHFFISPGNIVCAWNVVALPEQTIRWNVEVDAPPMLRESVEACLKQWTDATGGTLRFAEGEGGISFEWDETGGTIIDPLFLAYTTFNAGSTFSIKSAKVIVNANNYEWHRGGNKGVGAPGAAKREAELDGVLLHEIGHALGLNHSDGKPDAIVGSFSYNDFPTMNSFIMPGAETLHLDDETGIRVLYSGLNPSAVPAIQPLAIDASITAGKAPFNAYLSCIDGGDDTIWDFGDGLTHTGASVTHKFVTPGTYTVTATSNGRTGTIVVEATKRKVKSSKVSKSSKVKTKKRRAWK